MHVTVLGGGGTVGSTLAYTLAAVEPTWDLALADVAPDPAWGHATDIRHARAHAGHALGSGTDTGAVRAVDPGPAAVAGADCVVVTASVPRPTGGDERGGRDTYWPANREVADEIAGWLAEREPCPVLVVTNPLDRVVTRLHEQTVWNREHFLGYSLSETARVADAIARRVGDDPAAVDCPVLGEHGEHIVPAFSRATIDGSPLELSREAQTEITEYAREIPYEVIQRRGQRDSSRWVTGRGASLVVRALLDDRQDGPICLSTPLAGEYGIEGVALSVPVTLGEAGVERIHAWDLTASEREALETAAAAVDSQT